MGLVNKVPVIKYRHAEFISASHMLSDRHAVDLSCGIPKQVRDDGVANVFAQD